MLKPGAWAGAPTSAQNQLPHRAPVTACMRPVTAPAPFAGVCGPGNSGDQGVRSLAGEAPTAQGAGAQAQGWPPILGAGANADPSQQGEWLLAQKKAAGDPLEQLSKGRLTGAGVVHVPVVYQHLVEQDHAGVAGERLPGEPRGEGHERRRRSPWGDRIAVRPGPGLCAVPRGGLGLSFPLRVDTTTRGGHPALSSSEEQAAGGVPGALCATSGLGACVTSGGGAPRPAHPGFPSHLG